MAIGKYETCIPNIEIYPEIELRVIKDKKGLKAFVQFYLDLYKDCPECIPCLKFDEVSTLDPDNNPAYEFCDTVFIMAYIDSKPVGRICGLLNHTYNKIWERRCVRFTRFDFIDDKRVSEKLIAAVEAWAREQGMDEIQGPMGFCDLDKEGMLVEGFEHPNMFFTVYNHAYYVDHLENAGYEKSADWIEFKISVPPEIDPRVRHISEHVIKKNELTVVKFKKTKEILPYANKIFNLLYEAYKDLYGYIPLTQAQIDDYVNQFITIIRPDFASLIVDKDGEPVAFGLINPSMNEACVKSKGKMFPFGFVHLLKALKRKQVDVFDFMFVAVKPELQSQGLNAPLLCVMYDNIVKYGGKFCETGPMLENNTKIHLMWKRFDYIVHHRRRCYIKKLDK